MSDTKNHKLAIKAIIEAHRTPGKMREILLTILADKPSAIVNAWEEVKRDELPLDLNDDYVTCSNCFCLVPTCDFTNNNNTCTHCGFKQSESP